MYGLLRRRQVFLNFPANIEAIFWIRQAGTPLKFVCYSSTCRLQCVLSAEFAPKYLFVPYFNSNVLNFIIGIVLAKTGFQTVSWFSEIRKLNSVFLRRDLGLRSIGNTFSRFLSQSQEEHTFEIWFVVAICQSFTAVTVAFVAL